MVVCHAAVMSSLLLADWLSPHYYSLAPCAVYSMKALHMVSKHIAGENREL